MIDLLELTYDGKISFNEAYAVQDAHTSSFHFGDVDVSDWLAAFGLSKDVLKFTELEVVVRLHYEGWPKTCAQCKLPLNHKTERWLDVSRPEGEICLIHSSCWVEWVKRRWKSAVDALNRVGIQAVRFGHSWATLPENYLSQQRNPRTEPLFVTS